MIILISPAKSLNSDVSNGSLYSVPALQSDANKLAKILKGFSKNQLQELMSLSEALAEENVKRYKKFKLRAPLDNSTRAIELFAGDVYRGLQAGDFNEEDLKFAQDHLRILSGLYGVLRPLDKMQPYRLEMGTRLKTKYGKNLYEFWGDRITKQINGLLKDHDNKQIINLASEEYFKSVKKQKLKAEILNINFKEYHNGTLKFLSFNAKVARGMMARYIIKNRIDTIEEIKGFAQESYSFSEENSTPQNWIFIR